MSQQDSPKNVGQLQEGQLQQADLTQEELAARGLASNVVHFGEPAREDGTELGSSRPNEEPASFHLPELVDRTVGRGQEVQLLRLHLQDPQKRLVTLTGFGGIGKTRLAIIVAHSVQNEFDLGARFLSLASVRDGEEIPFHVQSALGLSGKIRQSAVDRIAAHLGEQSVLLVLDNLEQIIGCGAFLKELVTYAPTVKIMATSRVPLRVTGESLFDVEPLGLPVGDEEPEKFSGSDAVELFVSRSSAVRRHIEFTDSDVKAIAVICQRLDGIPLAIELAAARARMLSPTEILERLEQRLPLLTTGPRNAPPRLQSMSAAIGWSYDLLSNDEQSLFQALSVFEGGFSLDAAEAMAGKSELLPVDLVNALEDQSLIRRMQSNGEGRFRMLETVREFGLMKAAELNELEVLRDKHAAWFVMRLEKLNVSSYYSGSRSQLLLLPGDHDNLRSAVWWKLERGRPEQAAFLARGLSPYWNRTGQSREAFRVVNAILDKSDDCGEEFKADLMLWLGGTSYVVGEFERARQFSAQSLELFRAVDKRAGLCGCNNMLGLITRWSDPDESVFYFNEAYAIAVSPGAQEAGSEHVEFALSQRSIARLFSGNLSGAEQDAHEALNRLDRVSDGSFNRPVSLGTLAWLAGMEGDFEQARSIGEELLTLSEHFSVNEGKFYAHRVLGEASFATKDFSAALEHFKTALEIVDQVDLNQWRGFLFAEIAMTAAKSGLEKSAAMLWGVAARWFDFFAMAESTKRFGASWTGQFAPTAHFARNEKLVSAFDFGYSISDRESLQLALSIEPRPSRLHGCDQLTQRQLEVLQHMAAGRTNSDIANTLFISKRTVDRHATSIFEKLDVGSRGAAVAEALKRDLIQL